ncbi:DMT family transporter [Sphaerotilus sp.]|uniref:DMT family transporter n=1 Tax=Sphaerotilus sp. TaxID=2093942 RepID=UPI00286E03F8|nr:DMT family transporter [Sphaerotilus sp.]
MTAPVLMVLASFLFALMGVCVKLASVHFGTGEIVMYRGLIGAVTMVVLMRGRGQSLRTTVPWMHVWRGIVGVSSLCLWFYAISGLPLATAMTLNYMSPIWMAMFLIGGSVLMGGAKINPKLIATVLAGFVGVAAILRPSIDRDQLWYGVVGFGSGMLSAMAYLQITALGRVGEPETRVVFYFSCGGALAGLALMLLNGGPSPWHGWTDTLLLLGVGLFATGAQLAMTRAFAIGRPLVNASLQYLGIVFAFAFGVLLFDDPVHPLALVGMVLVVGAGITATQLRHGTGPRQNAQDTLPPDLES